MPYKGMNSLDIPQVPTGAKLAQAPPPPPDDTGAKLVNSKSKTVTAKELLETPVEQMPCLLGAIMPKTGLVALVGTSDVGKSSFLRSLAISVSAGEKDFLGWPLMPEHKSVIYVSSEDDRNGTAFVLAKQAQNISRDSLTGLRFLFDMEDLIPELTRELSRQRADLVILDCFTDIFGSDLKDAVRVRMFLNQFNPIIDKFQCLVLFLHHTGKRSQNYEPSKDAVVGSQAFEAKMRLVMELRGDHVSDSIRHLCILKGNYLPGKEKKESHVLEFFPDSFQFVRTGERVPFEMLSKAQDDNGKQKYNKAAELKAAGRTLDEIAKELGYSNRGAVSKLLKRFDDKFTDTDEQK